MSVSICWKKTDQSSGMLLHHCAIYPLNNIEAWIPYLQYSEKQLGHLPFLWIRIGFKADLDLAFNVNADLDPDPGF